MSFVFQTNKENLLLTFSGKISDFDNPLEKQKIFDILEKDKIKQVEIDISKVEYWDYHTN